MNPVRQLNIAIIGNPDQITFMRMGGVSMSVTIDEEKDVRQQVREALSTLRQDPAVGVIIIPEDLAGLIADEIEHIRQLKSPFPVIVEIPTHFDLGEKQIKEYYQSYAKKLIGFSIEI